MRSSITVLATALLLATSGGCGGAGRRDQPAAASGPRVFAAECSSCHSLIGNESRHKQGGDLLGYHISRADLTQFTREMPVRRPLTAAELRAVVDYVLRVQNSYGR